MAIKKYEECPIINNKFENDGVEYDCTSIIKYDKNVIFAEAEQSHKGVLEELYDKETLSPKSIRLFFDDKNEPILGMVLYTIKYKANEVRRTACGNYYPIRDNKISHHLFQGSICW